MSEKLPQLVMMLPKLQLLPPVQLPEGYSARSLRDGEDGDWEKIITESFKYPYRFKEKMSASSLYTPDRVQFICDANDCPVATATAWFNPKWGEECGYLHMVGVLAAHGGKGLGAQVSILALRRMEQEGHVKAVLNTDDFRLPAVRTYLKLGFIPYFNHESHRGRWTAIADQLGDQVLATRLLSSDFADAGN